MSNIALIFKFRDRIAGPGFQVGIRVEGRVRLSEEEADGGEFWMFGVNPGGLAEHGETPEHAYGAFRRAFKETLEELAAESTGPEDFRARVQAFVAEGNLVELQRWEAARQAHRLNAGLADDVFSNPLKVEEARQPGVIECYSLDQDGRIIAPVATAKKAPTTQLVEASNEDLALAA